MVSISAGTANFQASAVTLRIRYRECCIFQPHIGASFRHRYDRDRHGRLHEPPLRSLLVRRPDDRLRRTLNQSGRKWHELTLFGVIGKPGHADSQRERAPPQCQQNTHPHLTFAGLAVACVIFACGFGTVSRTTTSVTTSPQISRPHIPSIALFISALPLHRLIECTGRSARATVHERSNHTRKPRRDSIAQ